MKKRHPPSRQRNRTSPNQSNQSTSRVGNGSNITCYKCGGTGHIAKDCRSSVTSASTNNASKSCFRCGKMGHISKDCTAESRKPTSTTARNAAGVTCFQCGNVGHIAKYCTTTTQSSRSCYRCGEVGHLAKDCTSTSGGGHPRRTQNNNNIVCHSCGETGHMSRECPNVGRPCRECNEMGHGAAQCPTKWNCKVCKRKHPPSGVEFQTSGPTATELPTCIFSGCPECGCFEKEHDDCPANPEHNSDVDEDVPSCEPDMDPDFTTEPEARYFLQHNTFYEVLITPVFIKCLVEKDIIGMANSIKKNRHFTKYKSHTLGLALLAWDDVDFDYSNIDAHVGFYAPKLLVQMFKNNHSYNGYFDALLRSGRYDLLKVLKENDIRGAPMAPAWPPGSGTDQSEEDKEQEKELLLTASLQKALEHVMSLLLNAPGGDQGVVEAREMLRRIPPPVLRRAISHVPPYRADVVSLLYEMNVVDISVLYSSINMMEYRYYKCRTLVREWEPIPTIRAWDPSYRWTLSPEDSFDTKHMTLFPPPTPRDPSAPCIVSQTEFEANLRAFVGFDIGALLRSEPLKGFVVAGGCLVSCLLPDPELRPDIPETVRKERFRQPPYRMSDVDIFSTVPIENRYIDISKCEALNKTKRLIDAIQKALGGVQILVLVRARVLTVIPPYPHRRIQIHLGEWIGGADVVANSDVDCCGVYYDGTEVRFSQRGYLSWVRRTVIADGVLAYTVRGSPTYEKRLLKYALRGGFK
eukprot:PhF_6_TR11587/c0_g1_i3/m.18750